MRNSVSCVSVLVILPFSCFCVSAHLSVFLRLFVSACLCLCVCHECKLGQVCMKRVERESESGNYYSQDGQPALSATKADSS